MLLANDSSPIRLARIFIVALFAWIHCQGEVAFAQALDSKPLQLVVYAQPESTVATEPNLLPNAAHWQAGDAAPIYRQLIESMRTDLRDPQVVRAIYALRRLDAPGLLKDETLTRLLAKQLLLESLEAASWRQYAGWRTPLRLSADPDYNLQACELFGILLASKVRIDSASRDMSAASNAARIGLTLARHVSQGGTPGHALVALQIESAITRALLDFVQTPKAPNLYWSLRALPTPLVDFSQAWMAEASEIELSFPWISELETPGGEPDVWNKRLDEFATQLRAVTDARGEPTSLEENVIFGYPLAKSRLMKAGYLPEFLEAMPVSKVMLLDAYRMDKQQRAQVLKWLPLPFSESYLALKKSEEALRSRDGFGLGEDALRPYGNQLSLTWVRERMVENEQFNSMLAIVEALRISLDREGAFPITLDELQETTPCPIDSVSGQPFRYECDGKTATITGAAISGSVATREIKIAEVPLSSRGEGQ